MAGFGDSWVQLCEDGSKIDQSVSCGADPKIRTVDNIRSWQQICIKQIVAKPQRILENSPDYYVGLDVYTNTYYICFKSLWMADVDQIKHPRIVVEMVTEYTRQHPEYSFAIYSSRSGFHIFCISQLWDYSSTASISMMLDLKADFFYTIYASTRGWSIRCNPKITEWFKFQRTMKLAAEASVKTPTTWKPRIDLYRFIRLVGTAPVEPKVLELLAAHDTAVAKYSGSSPSRMGFRPWIPPVATTVMVSQSAEPRTTTLDTVVLPKSRVTQICDPAVPITPEVWTPKPVEVKSGSSKVSRSYIPKLPAVTKPEPLILEWNVPEDKTTEDGLTYLSKIVPPDEQEEPCSRKQITYITRLIQQHEIKDWSTVLGTMSSISYNAIKDRLDPAKIHLLTKDEACAVISGIQDYKDILPTINIDKVWTTAKFHVFISRSAYSIGYQIYQNPSRNMYYIAFKNLMVSDFDGVSREEVFTRLAGTEKTWRLYSTTNGFHAYCTSENLSHSNFANLKILRRLKCDLHYIKCAYRRGYCIRLSPKYSRIETGPIETYIGIYGTAPELPTLIRLVYFKDWLLLQ